MRRHSAKGTGRGVRRLCPRSTIGDVRVVEFWKRPIADIRAASIVDFADLTDGGLFMLTTALLILAGANVQPDVDILAQSKSGKMLCSNPDAATKSCSSISSFKVSADGSVTETTEILLTPEPPITFTMSIATEVTRGSNCGVMTLDDLRRGQVRANGEALPPDRNAFVLERLEKSMGSLAGKKVCDALQLENDNLVKYGQVEGVDIKLPAKPVMWVSPSDGYTVAPR